MKGLGNHRIFSYIIVALSLILFATQAIVLATANSFTLANTVPDDAYYYIKIAYSFAKQGLVSFDGTNPTNGFHPLWFWICSGIARFCSSEESLLRASLVVSCLCTAGVPFVLTRSKAIQLSSSAKACFIAITLSLASTRFIGSQTLEVGLYALMLSCLYLAIEDVWLRNGEVTTKDSLRFGAIFGVATLARLDCLFLVGLLFVLACIWRRKFIVRPTQLLVVAIPVVVCLLIWFGFSYLTVGYITHDSSTVKRMWIEADRMMYGSLRLRNFKWGLQIALFDPFILSLLSLASIVPMGALLWMARKNKPLQDLRAHASKLALPALLLVSVAIQGVLSRYLSADQFRWYMTPGYVAWLVFSLHALNLLAPRVQLAQLNRKLLGGLTGASVAIQYGLAMGSFPDYWGQSFYIQAIREVDNSIPKGATIGSWNSGVFALYSSHRVVNIDGLVNHEIIEYYRNRNYESCFKDLGIDYVFDVELAMNDKKVMIGKPRAEMYASKPLPLQPIRTLEDHGRNFVLYKVIK